MVLITVNFDRQLLWPPLPEKGDWPSNCKHELQFVDEVNQYNFQSGAFTLQVNVPAYGCRKCNFVLKPSWEARTVRDTLNQRLPGRKRQVLWFKGAKRQRDRALQLPLFPVVITLTRDEEILDWVLAA